MYTYTDISVSHHKNKRDPLCQLRTIFVTGDGNVVDSSEFETRAGKNLELYRT